jgi:hypothetical protein
MFFYHRGKEVFFTERRRSVSKVIASHERENGKNA